MVRPSEVLAGQEAKPEIGRRDWTLSVATAVRLPGLQVSRVNIFRPMSPSDSVSWRPVQCLVELRVVHGNGCRNITNL